MIASLGMYDRPEIARVNDAFWALIRDELRLHGVSAPQTLTRGDTAYWPAWTAPDLVMAQTCGLPFRAKLHEKVTLIGTPDYGVEGCPPGHYCSVLIARAEDNRMTEAAFASSRLAVNDTLSQSGWAAVHEHFQNLGHSLTPALHTGGHRASARAVAEGDADFAAIDAVTWGLLARYDDFAAGLRVVARTRPTPGLPLITARADHADLLFRVIGNAIAGLDPADRHSLSLRGLVRIPASAYLAVPIPPAPAQIDSTL